jgi:hypothetical protein
MRLFFDDAFSWSILNAELMPAFLALNRKNLRVPVDGGLEAFPEFVVRFRVQLAVGEGGIDGVTAVVAKAAGDV